jgi:hypothetical protein
VALKVNVYIAKTIDLVAEGRRVSLPYPASGYGGHELVVSPSDRYLALFLYSGQSEVGWELFELPGLRHIGRLPYIFGEGEPPVFSAGQSRVQLCEFGVLRPWTTERIVQPRTGTSGLESTPAQRDDCVPALCRARRSSFRSAWG